jgi:hypothetical protein
VSEAQETFTADSVLRMLRDAQRQNAKPLNLPEGNNYRFLAWFLNDTKRLHQHLKITYPPEREKRQKITDAIITLSELLPLIREDYDLDESFSPLDAMPAAVVKAVEEGRAVRRRGRRAFDRLLGAVEEAKQSGIPFVGVEELGMPLDKETEVIGSIFKTVTGLFPDLGVAARHRFIAAAMASVTGNTNLDEKKVKDRLNSKKAQ